MESSFPAKILDPKGNAVNYEDLPKVRALYFSASWCGPCRGFTPELSKFYEAVNKDSKRLEIIFVSWDQDEDSFKGYYGKMPWLAVDFNDPNREDLGETYGIQGVPFLLLIDAEGKALGKNVRADVVNSKGDYETVIKNWENLYN